MPKATPSNPAALPKDHPSLRRNQACRQCRKRKLKCDAQKPHCSTCVKGWKAQIAVPPPVGFSHPDAPLCLYDHMEGLGLTPVNADVVEDPQQRISLLSTQIEELRIKLETAHREAGLPVSDSQNGSGSGHDRDSPNRPTKASSHSPSNSYQWLNVPHPPPEPSQSITLPSPPLANRPSRPSSTVSGGHASSSSSSMRKVSSVQRPNSHPGNVNMDIDTERMHAGIANGTYYPTEGYEMIYSGVNADLPETRLLNHLVNLYFTCDTCASRILHRPTFLLAMTLPPTHPDYPHPALLHAICASASRWTATTKATRDTSAGERDKFAEFHAAKVRTYMDQTIATGQNIFSVLLAGIVLSWWFYSEGRWVEVWSHAGFLIRVSIPLGLNFPGTHRSNNATAYLAPPRNPTDLEQRRRAWWMTLMFDRIVSVGGWPHSIDERDIGTEFPLKRGDFETEADVPSNPQDLSSNNLFTFHNEIYTDPFMLFLKACMLFGRVTDYNTRVVNLKTNRLTLIENASKSPSQPKIYPTDQRNTESFRALDKLVANDFLDSFPVEMRSCLGVLRDGAAGIGLDIDGTSLNTDLYMAHLVPHAASITLHNPYINFGDTNCPSAIRCLTAARAILNAYYLMMSTNFDIRRLHPFVTICWYLAAVVLVQLCKHLIVTDDQQSEAKVWGEINLMRLAMIDFGSVSPIGIRQEKLLQGLMADILRLTSQVQPLDVSVPLYPFSRQSLYDPTFQPTLKEVTEASAPSPEIVSSLAGRTGERETRYRAPSQSKSHPEPSPPQPQEQVLQPPAPPQESSYVMDSLGLGFFDGPMNGPGMISSQGLWRPMDIMGNGDDGLPDFLGQFGL